MFPSSDVSSPSTYTFPAVGIKSPLIFLARVDLPEPFCPIIAVNFPFSTARLTSSSARYFCPSSSFTYSNTRFFISIKSAITHLHSSHRAIFSKSTHLSDPAPTVLSPMRKSYMIRIVPPQLESSFPIRP